MTFSFTLLGLGAMGQALATTALDAGHRLTVWNRTPGKAAPLTARGADATTSVGAAIGASDLVVVCLFDYGSVHDVLTPHTDALAGTAVVNLTSTYDGEDAGLASMWDLAMLSGMYSMFAGFLHGVAMLATAGVPAGEYAQRAAPFLAAMTPLLGHATERLDTRDYSDAVQSLHWTSTLLDTIARASREQGIEPAPVEMVQQLLRRQIDAGHGAEDFDRTIESMR